MLIKGAVFRNIEVVLHEETRREEQMMPTMMFGMATSMFLWLVLATLLCLLLIGLGIWLVARWLKQQRMPQMQSTPQPRDAYEGYEQGYQAQEPKRPTYQEGDQLYSYPHYEQPQTLDQAMEQLRH
jgi:ABC-type nickel/cobalt efflux system permease component RcnA